MPTRRSLLHAAAATPIAGGFAALSQRANAQSLAVPPSDPPRACSASSSGMRS